jgi:gamma-glutamyltranspeptidase/glutathione hydrolase
MMIRFADGGTACIDYRETAPAAASRDVYLDSAGQIIPKASTQGYRASGVPGTPAGLCLAQKKYGRLSLNQVMQPAIDLAEHGFPVSDHLSDSLKAAAPLLELFPESRRVYLNGGKYFEPGSTLMLTDLARSLKTIRDKGADGFYRGEIAAKMAAAYEPHGRWMTREDLSRYEPRFRTPLRGSYRGYDVITMPPPSSGGTVLIEILNALEGFNVSGMGAGSSRTIHLMAEAMRHAFRDRADLMGDTDFVKVPVGQLILKAYASEFR